MSKIYLIRGQKVMLDMDLAELYKVETKQLKRAVRRNDIRFPDDFMFELNKEELENLRSQIGTSSWGGVRYAPMAFTEQGVAMLSSILNSERAVLVNIHIIRIFTRMRSRYCVVHYPIIVQIDFTHSTNLELYMPIWNMNLFLLPDEIHRLVSNGQTLNAIEFVREYFS